jgi:DNA repair exonuclease SbcCD ATPase subunit
MESWESGEAMLALKRQREELKVKRDILEQRQKDAKRVLKRVIKEQQQQTISSVDSMPPPAPVLSPSNGEPVVVGGLLVQDELDAMEAEESVRMHLNTIKQQEIKLSEEEKTLNAETMAHIRSLKRLANEDSSRFQKVPKVCSEWTSFFLCLLPPFLFSS